jgi:hypothetical protein
LRFGLLPHQLIPDRKLLSWYQARYSSSLQGLLRRKLLARKKIQAKATRIKVQKVLTIRRKSEPTKDSIILDTIVVGLAKTIAMIR